LKRLFHSTNKQVWQSWSIPNYFSNLVM